MRRRTPTVLHGLGSSATNTARPLRFPKPLCGRIRTPCPWWTNYAGNPGPGFRTSGSVTTEAISTLDLLGPGFTLFTGNDDWCLSSCSAPVLRGCLAGRRIGRTGLRNWWLVRVAGRAEETVPGRRCRQRSSHRRCEGCHRGYDGDKVARPGSVGRFPVLW